MREEPDFMTSVRMHFDAVAADVLARLESGEEATLNIAAEQTLFVRFNNNRVRQNTDVEQIGLSLRLQTRGRTVEKGRTVWSGSSDALLAARHELKESLGV